MLAVIYVVLEGLEDVYRQADRLQCFVRDAE